ncbi:MAG: adenylate/guanylate cyclase domain-containing protein [Microscillaceae bacterium]|nr:adenylate/guanylate cyclase domain-containing protein [Microscillaceae bacterium]MDW8460481.1 adenylate/guanylate cyclase domain-containing protein [Cytophagales bacterium]
MLPIVQESTNTNTDQIQQLLNDRKKELQNITNQKQRTEVKILTKTLRADIDLDLDLIASSPIKPKSFSSVRAPIKVDSITDNSNKYTNKPIVIITPIPKANTNAEPSIPNSPVATSKKEEAVDPPRTVNKISQKDLQLLLAQKEMQLLKEQEAKKQVEIAALVKTLELRNLRQRNIIYLGAVGLGLSLVVTILLFRNVHIQRKANRELVKQKQETELARNQSEALLLNILPASVAQELKTKGKAEAKYYELASVLFCDFQGFTSIAEKMKPNELLAALDECFMVFDEIISRYHLEKIKTIGDAYMCVGGVPEANRTNPVECVLAGLEIQQFMKQKYQSKKLKGEEYWKLRLGINSGELVAGVVGKKKFAYDVWGDTVNTASRMESSGEVDEVNISGKTYELVKDFFECEYRGKLNVKGKGQVDMYFVRSIKPELSKEGKGLEPNKKFWELLKQKTENC